MSKVKRFVRIFWKKPDKNCKNSVYRTLFVCYNRFILCFMSKEIAMPILPLRPEDRIQMKKAHPCGGKIFRIVRVGSEVRVICETCGRDMTLDRVKLEKAIKQILTDTTNSQQ